MASAPSDLTSFGPGNPARRLATAALAALLPCMALAAQDAEGDPAAGKGGGAGGELTELQYEQLQEEKAGKAPAPKDPNAAIGGLEKMAGFIVGFHPRRIAPGGSGEMRVVVALRGDAVLVPNGRLEPRLPESLRKVTFGAWTVSDPAPASHAAAFTGQEVWDNTLTISVPVTVAGDAEYGKVPLFFPLIAEVFDGDSGQRRGVFQTQVRGQLEIGDPLPTPIPRAGGAGGAPRPAQPQGGPRAADDGSLDDRSSGDSPRATLGGQRAEGDVRSGDSGDSPAPLLNGSGPTDDGGDGMLLPLVGGGVILLVLVLLIASRRGR